MVSLALTPLYHQAVAAAQPPVRWLQCGLMPGVVSAGLFSFLLGWRNVPRSLFTTGADSILPEWLYAKMLLGYSPLVPTVGVLSIAVSVVILTVAYVIFRVVRTLHERLAAAT